jgi:hypothetical protein
MGTANSQDYLESKKYKAIQTKIRQGIEAHLRDVAERCMKANGKPHKAEIAFMWQALSIMDELDKNGVDDDDSQFDALYKLEIAFEMLYGKSMKTVAEVEAEAAEVEV